MRILSFSEFNFLGLKHHSCDRQVNNAINFYFIAIIQPQCQLEGSEAAKSCDSLPLGPKMADFHDEVLSPFSCPAQLMMKMESVILCPSGLADYFIKFRCVNEGN